MRGLRFIETYRGRQLRRDAPSAEKILWRRLRSRGLAGYKFVRQEPVGPYFADFACRESKLVVEIDGATHSTDEEVAGDARRTAFLEAKGYRVLRFTNEQVFENLEAVETIILAKLGSA
jgi:very-short-patch-repair endonuclease